MSETREKYSPAFKAMVAIAAVKETEKIAEVARRYSREARAAARAGA